MKNFASIMLALALTIAPALIHGEYTNRWGTPADLTQAGDKLHELPRRIGQWVNVEDERPLSEAVCRELGLVEHFHRQYEHTSSGERVNVLLMVGPPGRLVRHPPDVCYANRANQQVGEAESIEIAASESTHQFSVLRFRRTAVPVKSQFEVAYAFCDRDGSWSAPNSPRITFGASQILYKLQVLAEDPSEESLPGIERFLAEFVETFSSGSANFESLTIQ